MSKATTEGKPAAAEAERAATERQRARVRLLEAERLADLPRLTVQQIRAAASGRATPV